MKTRKMFVRAMACLAAALLAGCTPTTSGDSMGDSSQTVSTAPIRDAYTDDPMKDTADPQAYSGDAGMLYYISWNAIKTEFGNKTEMDYDALSFIAALQGVLNRDTPVMYIDYAGNTDMFWYKYLKRPGKLLYGYSQKVISSLDDFLTQFKDDIVRCGLFQWDPSVPATSNVAITACSVSDMLPVRAGSAVTKRILEKTGAAVKVDVNGKFTGTGKIADTSRTSTGSKKCDAYIWALEKYMDKTNPAVLGYLLDAQKWRNNDNPYPDLNNAFVVNRDYLIARRGFAFDLSVWSDEAPNDDPTQPVGADYRTLREIMQKASDRNKGDMITVCGFVPWARKYTDVPAPSAHGDVQSEWKSVQFFTSYNAIIDSDSAPYGYLSNASVYMHYKLKDKYTNTHFDTSKVTYDPAKQYVLMYLGDYDAAAWVKNTVPRIWTDPARGSIPLAWPFDQNLSDRIPMVFDYLYEYKTNNDIFIAGDSGAGYVFPEVLFDRTDSNLPSGEEAFVKHNRYYFEKFDIDFVGFMVNPVHPIDDRIMNMFSKFSPRGAVTSGVAAPYSNGAKFDVVNNAVFIRSAADLPQKDTDGNSAQTNGNFILNALKFKSDYNFYSFRSILWTPTQIKALQDYVTSKNSDVVFCDPETFTELARQAWNRNH